MKRLALLMVALGVMSGLSLWAQDVAGDWQGTVKTDHDLRIILRITGATGSLKAVAYSIDQGPQPMNTSDVTLKGLYLSFAVPSIGGSYGGELSGDGKTISGSWTQGKPFPLVFVRATKETA